MLGYNLSSRLAEDYLINLGKISNIHKEELEEKTKQKIFNFNFIKCL